MWNFHLGSRLSKSKFVILNHSQLATTQVGVMHDDTIVVWVDPVKKKIRIKDYAMSSSRIKNFLSSWE
jgi:hypothetical protein